MAYNNYTSSTTTVVECHKQVRSWRLLRSLVEALIPCCFEIYNDHDHDHHDDDHQYHLYHHPTLATNSSNCYTGTIFGQRRGKVSFCIQNQRSPSSDHLLLLELAVSTQTLAREMRGGFLRIALETTTTSTTAVGGGGDLLSAPVWTMYCNGRRVGYAVKRRPTEADSAALRLMGSGGDSGAGVIRRKKKEEDEDEIMYLRAKFERVCGSQNSESFHLVDDERSIGQELSVFFYRSR